MPFTISHAGFVLPLKGILSAHVLCGLVIGSIVPDFGYFVREFGVASFAHTFAGALCFSLPVGLAVYLLVCLSFRRIAGTLPKPHSSFLMSWGLAKPGGKQNLHGIMLAIFVGSLSHNFVDSFTHESGAGVAMFTTLSKEAFVLGGEPLHIFRILQYSGSALGMAMILAAYWFGMIRHCRASRCRVWQDFRSWLVLIVLTSASLLVAAALNSEFFPRELDFHAFRVFGFKFLITWLPVIGMAFLCYVIMHLRTPTSEQMARQSTAISESKSFSVAQALSRSRRRAFGSRTLDFIGKAIAWCRCCKGEFGFWLLHCLISILPYLAFAVSMGSGKPLTTTALPILTAVVLFAAGCTLIAMRWGGFAKSRSLFPRALRIILRIRMALVAALLAGVGVSSLGVEVSRLLTVLGAPDIMCVVVAGNIYERFADNVSISGNATLTLLHPFLSMFAGTAILALVWSTAFLALSLLTMIPLRIYENVRHRRRIRSLRGSGHL